MLFNIENSEVSESLEEKIVNCIMFVMVKCVFMNIDFMKLVDIIDLCMLESEILNFLDDGFIVVQLIGSEIDVEIDDECMCVFIDLGLEEF